VSNRVLLVEDDMLFGETIVDLLEDEGYTVVHVPNGQSALDASYKANFDIYLLDINLPLLDGLSLLKELREAEDATPTIFLTSRTDKESLERGFINGGDDYLVKPFDTNELLLRMQALLRRAKGNLIESVGPLLHDSLHKTIKYHGSELELSRKEYELLLLFMQHADKVVPKELILQRLWSSSEGGSDGAIRVYVNRLKQLLPDMTFENVRGIGYRLVS
jgi:DNA-binding response OmpR family regulator